MEEPSLEVVLKALDALFRKEDTQDKEQASLWLTQLQSSVRPLTGPVCDFYLIRTMSISATRPTYCVGCVDVGPRLEGGRPAVAASTGH